MILGWFVYSALFILLLSSFIPVLMKFYYPNNNVIPANLNTELFSFRNNTHGDNFSPSSFSSFFSISLFGGLYFLYWIIQAADANRLAKKFNKHLDKTGELLWY